MAVQRVQYFFGRLHLIATFPDKRAYLLQGFRGGQIVERSGSGWGFFEVEEIADTAEEWIYGYLVKYKPQTEEEIVVPETQQLEDEAVENRVRAKSRFFIHIESGIIAYRPISHQISRGQFLDNFVKVFLENHQRFFVDAQIQSINEEYQLLEELRRFSRIQEVVIDLHPSNPSNRELWARTDARIKQLNATSYQEKIEAAPGSSGLSIIHDEETTAKITMAVDGYGRARVKGTLDGKPHVVSTDDNPVTTQAPNDEADVKNIFDTILLTYRIIKNRFQK